MSIEDTIRAWKADEDDQNTSSVANPVGEELTDREMLLVAGRCGSPATFICPACGGGPSCLGTTQTHLGF